MLKKLVEAIDGQTPRRLGVECEIEKNKDGRITSISMKACGQSEGEFVVRNILRAIVSKRIQFRAIRSNYGEPYLLAINPSVRYLDDKFIAIPIPNDQFREFKLFAGRREYYRKKTQLTNMSFAWGGSFTLEVCQ